MTSVKKYVDFASIVIDDSSYPSLLSVTSGTSIAASVLFSNTLISADSGATDPVLLTLPTFAQISAASSGLKVGDVFKVPIVNEEKTQFTFSISGGDPKISVKGKLATAKPAGHGVTLLYRVVDLTSGSEIIELYIL